MSLDATLEKRPPHQRSHFEAQLRLLASESALGLQARFNFESECRLSDDIWEEFIDAVLSATPEAASIRASIRQVMRKHILTGPHARLPSGTIFGRVVTLKRLARTFTANGYFASPSAAHSHIRSMRTKSLDLLHKRWEILFLGRFVMWGTFNLNGGRPFTTMNHKAEEIMGILGLSREDEVGPSNPLLMMEYSLPPSTIPRIPRIAEAYSGEDWVYYFRPAPKAEKNHGLTLPWAEFSSCAPRPEVVHEPIPGNYLVMPLWETM